MHVAGLAEAGLAEAGLAVVVAIGGLLVTSGAAKLRTGGFAADLANYHLLPHGWVIPTAQVLPWVETAVGAALLFSPWATAPLLVAAAALIGVFTLGITANLLRGRRIPCGCRGTRTPISWRLAAVNTCWVLTGLSAAVTTPPSPISALAGHQPTVSAHNTWAVLLAVALSAIAAQLSAAGRQLGVDLDRVAQLTGQPAP